MIVPNRNGAVASAVLVHLRVEPAHFDWRWRERPALARLAWEAWLAIRLRGYAAFKWSQLILGRLAIINRDIAASALLIASTLALMAALDALERRLSASPHPEPHGRRYGAAARAYRDGTGFDSLGCSL
jgi:hypothetical protein